MEVCSILQVFLAVLGVLAFFYLLFFFILLFRAYSELRAMPYFGKLYFVSTDGSAVTVSKPVANCGPSFI